MRRSLARSALVAATLCCGAAAAAQSTPADTALPPSTAALLTWLGLDAPPGHEVRAATAIRSTSPDWRLDRMSNLVLTRGSGTPHRVVACGMDQGPAYVVSEITDAGYLRLRRSGTARPLALWDQ